MLEINVWDYVTVVLPVVSGAVVGAILKPVMDGLQWAWAWLGRRGEKVKRLALLGLGCVAAIVTKATGVPVPADLFHMDAGALSMMLNAFIYALVGHFTHKMTHTPAAE